MEEVFLHKREWDYYNDQLTGLKNRYALFEYLKTTHRLNIFIINIDNFSNINMIYGFLAGDTVLKKTADYLKKIIEKDMMLFRFHGDEFVILTERFMNFRELEDFAVSVVSFFEQLEFDVDKLKEIKAKISVSVGIAMGTGIVTLNHAQLAVKESRENARGAYKLFTSTSTFYKNQQELIYWINKIKESIEEDNLVSYYQPIKNVHSNRVEKFECLARVNDESLVVSPARFMEAARITGTLQLITRTIISKAYKDFQNTDYEFSINLTANDIKLGYLEEFLDHNTKKYGINPGRVTLELLEDIKTLTEENMLEQINRLRAKGFKIALDDFGVENSNFARLIELKPDFLKIDGVFIKDIFESRNHEIIVESIIDFCKKIDVKIVAEYISSKEIYDKLVKMGIDFAQGFYIGQPLKQI